MPLIYSWFLGSLGMNQCFDDLWANRREHRSSPIKSVLNDGTYAWCPEMYIGHVTLYYLRYRTTVLTTASIIGQLGIGPPSRLPHRSSVNLVSDHRLDYRIDHRSTWYRTTVLTTASIIGQLGIGLPSWLPHRSSVNLVSDHRLDYRIEHRFAAVLMTQS